MNRWLVAVLVAVFWCAALAQEPAPGESAEVSAASRHALIGAPAGQPLSGASLDQKTIEVAALLRCPVCQGLSIADSPAAMAINMKREVRDLLAEGYSGDQVLAYFEKSYGEFVRLQPPLRGFNWLVWLAPVAALIAGVFIVMRFVRPRSPVIPAFQKTIERSPGPTHMEPASLQPANHDPYLEQVRRLAYTNDETGGRPRDRAGEKE